MQEQQTPVEKKWDIHDYGGMVVVVVKNPGCVETNICVTFFFTKADSVFHPYKVGK